MGIIQKQALRTTVINFIGAGFGAVTRILMPIIISPAQVGLLNLLDSISGIFVTIFSLGFEQILAKMFPSYRDDEKGHHGFLVFGIRFWFLPQHIQFTSHFFPRLRGKWHGETP